MLALNSSGLRRLDAAFRKRNQGQYSKTREHAIIPRIISTKFCVGIRSLPLAVPHGSAVFLRFGRGPTLAIHDLRSKFVVRSVTLAG